MRIFSKSVIIIIVMVLTLGLCIGYIFKINSEYRYLIQQMEYAGEGKVKLKLSYRACPCGNEYPQFVIDSVLYSEYRDKNDLINRQLQVEFIDKKLKDRFYSDTLPVGEKYLLLKGRIVENSFGMMKLINATGNYFYRN